MQQRRKAAMYRSFCQCDHNKSLGYWVVVSVLPIARFLSALTHAHETVLKWLARHVLPSTGFCLAPLMCHRFIGQEVVLAHTAQVLQVLRLARKKTETTRTWAILDMLRVYLDELDQCLQYGSCSCNLTSLTFSHYDKLSQLVRARDACLRFQCQY